MVTLLKYRWTYRVLGSVVIQLYADACTLTVAKIDRAKNS